MVEPVAASARDFIRHADGTERDLVLAYAMHASHEGSTSFGRTI